VPAGRRRGLRACPAQTPPRPLISTLPPGNSELDLESLAIDGDHIWIAGSPLLGAAQSVRRRQRSPHSRRDARPSQPAYPGAAQDRRPTAPASGAPATCHSPGRAVCAAPLAGDRWLQPFLETPSKENGLDIEGLALRNGVVLLGCRGRCSTAGRWCWPSASA